VLLLAFVHLLVLFICHTAVAIGIADICCDYSTRWLSTVLTANMVMNAISVAIMS